MDKDRAAVPKNELEQMKQRLIQEMNEEILRETENTERQERLEEQQAIIRKLQLEKTCFTWFKKRRIYEDYVLQTEDEKDWSQYMLCDGLPNPKILRNLTTFMYLWSLEDFDINNISKKCEVVAHIIDSLDNIILESSASSNSYIKDCKFIKQQLRHKLQFAIDMASYFLLRFIKNNMIEEDLKYARYAVISNRLICCIWALIRLPISLKHVSEKDRIPIEVYFEELDLSVKMPLDVDCYNMAIRVLRLAYDHYSDQSKSFRLPDIPEDFQTDKDLLTYCTKEYKTTEEIRRDQAEKRRLLHEEKRHIIEKITKPNSPPPTNASPADATKKSAKKKKKVKRGKSKTDPSKKKIDFERELELLSYLPTSDEIIVQKQDEFAKKRNKLLFTECNESEINLRKYVILGGIFHIDLVYQPPQPKDLQNDVYLTTLQMPKNLRRVPFDKPYVAPPPAPESERTPEVIEAEIKALEAAMEKLALITLKLPDSVFWFEPPLVAHWEVQKEIWSTENVHDIKYTEEKQQIAFRSGKFGVHGLAAYKFVNLPFQSWELKPEKMIKGKNTGVVLSITAAIVQAELVVREDLVCLHSLAGGSATVLQNLVDDYMPLNSLIQKMRSSGCDLFPDIDAFNYVKGLSQKHAITEKHLAECMGLLSNAYIFSWSRWNSARASRQIVFQMKELHGCVAKQRLSETILVTPLETSTVQCTEVSAEFNEKSGEGEENKFYADLYHLALSSAGIKTQLSIRDLSPKLAVTVSKLLQSTNVISMSS